MSTRAYYTPRSEEDFNDFAINFTEKVITNAVTWVVSKEAKIQLVTATDDWSVKYADGNPEADTNSAQRQSKNDAPKSTTAVIRTIVNNICVTTSCLPMPI